MEIFNKSYFTIFLLLICSAFLFGQSSHTEIYFFADSANVVKIKSVTLVDSDCSVTDGSGDCDGSGSITIEVQAIDP